MEEREPQNLEWTDPEERAKRENEAWLRARHRVVAPLLIGLVLAIFIIPWLFMSFLGALAVQIVGCLALYLFGKKFTTAFDKKRPF